MFESGLVQIQKNSMKTVESGPFQITNLELTFYPPNHAMLYCQFLKMFEEGYINIRHDYDERK